VRYATHACEDTGPRVVLAWHMPWSAVWQAAKNAWSWWPARPTIWAMHNRFTARCMRPCACKGMGGAHWPCGNEFACWMDPLATRRISINVQGDLKAFHVCISSFGSLQTGPVTRWASISAQSMSTWLTRRQQCYVTWLGIWMEILIRCTSDALLAT
jgi:hypothetical protein